MKLSVTPDNYLQVIAELIDTEPELRTEDQIETLVEASGHLPFFIHMKKTKSFDVASVQREICRAMRKMKVKANHPILRAGSDVNSRPRR